MAKCKHDGCIDWQAALAAKAPQPQQPRDFTRPEGLYLKFSDYDCGVGVDQNTPVVIERVNGDCSVSEFIIARDEAYKLVGQLSEFLREAAAPKPAPNAAMLTCRNERCGRTYTLRLKDERIGADRDFCSGACANMYHSDGKDSALDPERAGPAPGAERLREALSKLVNECRGVVDLSGDKLRFIIGNTNFAVFDERIAEGREALAAAPPAPLSGESPREFIVNEVTQNLGRLAKELNGGQYETVITHTIMPVACRAAISAFEACGDRHASAERVRQLRDLEFDMQGFVLNSAVSEQEKSAVRDFVNRLSGALPPSTGEKGT